MRATPETKAKLEQTVKALGFKGNAHFFTRCMETLLEQTGAGEALLWPLRFEQHKKGPVTVKPRAQKHKKA